MIDLRGMDYVAITGEDASAVQIAVGEGVTSDEDGSV